MIRLERRWYITATVVALAGILLLLRPWQESGPTVSDSANLQATPQHDTFARDIHTSLYNADGQLQYTVRAESQMGFGNALTELTRPVIRLFDDAVLRWDVSADQGRIFSGSASVTAIERMELINRVNVVHSDESGFLMRMQTGFLTIEPGSETLRTNQRVFITGDGFEQQATGLIADLSQDRLTFLSNLEGRYHDRQNH